MDKSPTNDDGTKHEHKKDSRLKKFNDWLIPTAAVLWEDFKSKHARDIKFWVEVAALLGLLLYTTVAFCQLQATLQVMRLDQRPWIAPKPNGALQLNVGQRIGWEIYFHNIGKTAAFNIKIDARMEIVQEGQELTFDYPQPHPRMNFPVLWQNEPTPPKILLSYTSSAQPIIFTTTLSQQYKDREIEIVSYGQIRYWDMWGIEHLTTFCKSERAPEPSGITFTSPIGMKCTAYNSVDKNY